jgi:hypothetical protein
MYGEKLNFGAPETDIHHVTGSYIATLATFGTVQIPPVLRQFRPATSLETPAPAIVEPSVADVLQPVSFANFQTQPTVPYASSVVQRTYALAA